MTFLIEDPLPILFIGAALVAMCVVWWFQTGHKAALGAIVGVLAITGALVMLERSIVTERERVEETLYGLAEAMRANDAQAALAHLDPDATRQRHWAERMFQQFKVRTAKIGSDLKIRTNELTYPPSAYATFTGRIDVENRQGTSIHNSVLTKFTLQLQRKNDRWYVSDYRDDDDDALLQDR